MKTVYFCTEHFLPSYCKPYSVDTCSSIWNNATGNLHDQFHLFNIG